MPQFDLYGLGNALVDTEYRVSDKLLEALDVEKGMMTLIDDVQLVALEKEPVSYTHLTLPTICSV